MLSDGGVYDNLGLETAWKACTTVLVSDAGGQMAAEPDPDHDWGRHLFRVLSVIDNQVRSLRKRQCVEAFKAHERAGRVLGHPQRHRRLPTSPTRCPAPHDATMALATLSTRLARLDDDVQERLINWGYAVCDAGMRAHVDKALPAPAGISLWPSASERAAAALPAAPALRLERAVLRRQRGAVDRQPRPRAAPRRRHAAGRAPALSLGLLGETEYSDGRAVQATDFISDPRRDYRAQYVTLRVARPDLKNRTYGHAVEQNGRLWLQYWLWYFYNDYSLALNAGLHEGDWEMVQLRMHGDEPDVAVYAQHVTPRSARGHDVEQDDGHPVVYVARGSHASYFEAGFHTTEAWYDIADGKRKIAGADARDPRRRRPRLGALARALGRHPAAAPGRPAAAEPDRPGRQGAVERAGHAARQGDHAGAADARRGPRGDDHPQRRLDADHVRLRAPRPAAARR